MNHDADISIHRS